MAKEILLKHGDKAKLLKALNTTRPTLLRALRFEDTDNKEHQKIRQVAIQEYNGVICNQI